MRNITNTTNRVPRKLVICLAIIVLCIMAGSAWAATYIQNAGMEGGFTSGVPNNWTKYTLNGTVTIAQSTGTVNSGSNAVSVSSPSGAEGGVWQSFDVTNGQSYTISVYCKNGCGYLDVDPQGGQGNHANIAEVGTGGTGFTILSETVTATGGTGKITVYLDSWNGTAYYDDVFIGTNGTAPGADCNANAATYVSNTVPDLMNPSTVYSPTVVMKNSGGTYNWTDSPQAFNCGAPDAAQNNLWQARAHVNGPLPPGQQKGFPFSVTAPSSQAVYTYQIQMVHEAQCWFGDTMSKKVLVKSGSGPFPWPDGSTAHALPGTVQAEDFDFGDQGVGFSDGGSLTSNSYNRPGPVFIESCGDTGGGYDIGDTAAGNWWKYTCNVTSAGSYNFTMRVASAGTGGQFRIDVDGATGTVTNVPNTGAWQTYQDVTVSAGSISAGSHVIKVNAIAGGWNFNYFTMQTGCVSPSVSIQPTAQTGCAGSTTTFTLTAGGTSPTYQWRKNGSNIANGATGNGSTYGGCTTNTLTITNTQSADAVADASGFDCVVTGSCGSPVTSNRVGLTMGTPPSIGTQPTAQSGNIAGSASFSLSASGTGLTYQWRRNGTNIANGTSSTGSTYAGCTSNTLTISGIKAGDAAADAAGYDCVVTGTCSSATSGRVGLTVSGSPYTGTAIALPGRIQAENFDNGGQDVAYHEVIEGSNPGLKNNGDSRLTDYVDVQTQSGYTDVEFIKTGEWLNYTVDIAYAGTYTLTLHTASTCASQQMKLQLDGVDITSAVSLTNTGSDLVFSDNVVTGVSLPAGRHIITEYTVAGNCSSWGGPDLDYIDVCTAPVAPSSASATPSSVCSGGSSVLSYSGGSGSTLAWYSGSCGGTLVGTGNSLSVSPTSTTTYYCRWESGVCGNSTCANVTVTVKTPTSVTNPAGGSICAGGSLPMSVTGSGSGTLSYQWKKDGGNVGTNSSSYTATAAGSYSCTVTGDCGSATSNAAAVTLNTATSVTDPVGGSICAGGSLPMSVTGSGSGTLSYQWKKDGGNVGTNSSSYTATAAGSYTCTVTGNCGSATSNAAAVTVNTATSVTDPVGGSICAGGSLPMSVTGSGSGTLSYQWKKDGGNVGTNSSSYTATTAGSYTCVVTGDCGSATSNAAVVTLKAATQITTQPVGGTTCIGGSIAFSIAASGEGTLSYQWKKDGSDISGATSDTLPINPVAAGDAGAYTCEVSGGCGSLLSDGATLTISSGTEITTQPAGGAICSGGSLELSVVATGDGTLSYQWKKDGANVGTDSATFSATEAGSYTCDVTGGCGTATSDAAVVTLKAATAITTQPAGGAICSGGSLELSVVATGDGTLSYQWKKDGANVGTDSATFSATEAGSYTCDVTGGCGTATSDAAVVTLKAATAITTQPAGGAICSGGSLGLSVVATGEGTLSYKWKKDGANVGTDSASLSATEAGSYTCDVTGGCGTATSDAAVVTLKAATAITTQPVGGAICSGGSLGLSVVATGDGTLSYQWKKDGAKVGTDSATFSATEAGSYTCDVTGGCGTATSDAAVVTVNNAVSITTQPSSLVLPAGATAAFNVAASGTDLAYQWKKGGSDISGATSSSYSITGIGTGDSGSFTCTVTGSCGPIDSDAATLTVLTSDGSIASAKTVGDGQPVEIGNKDLYMKTSLFGYIEEPKLFTGIRVQGNITANAGQRVCLVGTIHKPANAEPYIDVATMTALSDGTVKPVAAANGAVIRGIMDGLYVVTFGRVKAGSLTANSYVITDGSDDAGVKVITSGAPAVSEGDYTIVTGAAGIDGIARVIYQQ